MRASFRKMNVWKVSEVAGDVARKFLHQKREEVGWKQYEMRRGGERGKDQE